jgi:lipopolysaccharide export system protein LptC
MRHSRLVHWLRFGVPGAIALALLTVVAANYMSAITGLRRSGDFGSLGIKGTKITMKQPRLNGFTADSRPYDFTADSADQDITKPDMMELHQVHAKVEMQDKSMTIITSDSGIYNMKTEMLTLLDNVHVVSSSGNEMRLSEATVDIHKGDVKSEKPVWVKLTNGFINAKWLEVVDGGDMIRFGGGVAMTVTPQQDTQAAQQ